MPEDDKETSVQPMPTAEKVWRKVGTQIEADTLRRLKRFVAEEETEMREVITTALNEYFDRRSFR